MSLLMVSLSSTRDTPRSSIEQHPRAIEVIDFGYPQNSETDTLKTYITTESIVSTNIAAVRALLVC